MSSSPREAVIEAIREVLDVEDKRTHASPGNDGRALKVLLALQHFPRAVIDVAIWPTRDNADL